MRLKEYIKKLSGISALIKLQRMQHESSKLLIAKGIVSQMRANYAKVSDLSEVEFSVFSQSGDDGIIQYLINTLDIKEKFFIEFGVQNYIESNTRFLLMNDNWSGLILDGSEEHINFIRNDYYYWAYNLRAKKLFITKDNINQAFEEEKVSGEIGLLHIDIDGNDYWIWKAIHVVNPVIVIVEYNAGFGADRSITVPYRHDFERYNAHYSGLYYGASLQAFCDLAEEKGYAFVGSNLNGNNAYFVRKDKLGSLKPVSCKEGYRVNYCRQNKDEQGNFTCVTDKDVVKQFSGLEVLNIRTNKPEPLN